MCRAWVGLSAGILLAGSTIARAQVTPAAGYTAPDDTPSYKVGTVIYADYTYVDEPTALDADLNVIHPSGFNVTRAYINVTGNINHLISFRVTPDITRLTTTNTGLGPGEKVTTSLDGSLTFRLKYAFGQFNFDNSISKGSWARFGLQQTPYIDWLEGVYRYRFQGTIFVEREGPLLSGGFLSSSDFGLSFHYNFPKSFGDLHVGYYNGDTYSKPEANDQNAVQVRVSFRPVPNLGVLKGLRLTGFYDADNYAQNDDRTRLVGTVTFEHRYVNAGYEHLNATDRPTAASAKVEATGYSIWATPRFPKGWEMLLRYDNFKPNKDVDATKNRKLGGVAYWFNTPSPNSVAMLLDYEKVSVDPALAKPDEKRYALHTLFTF